MSVIGKGVVICNLRFIFVSFITALLSSCVCTTSDAIMRTCDFKTDLDSIKEPFSFYQLDNNYYIELHVRHVCNVESLSLGSGVVASRSNSCNLPITIKRDIIKKYYFVLPPEAVAHYLSTRSNRVDNLRQFYREQEWDNKNAKLVSTNANKNSLYVGISQNANIYVESTSELYLAIPKYRPWDYWIKRPCSYILFIGVDVPCTLLFSATACISQAVSALWE